MNTISTIFALIASIVIFVTIIFILFKDWREQVSRYYAFFALFAFGILFTMFLTYAFPDYFDLTRVNRVTQMSTMMTFAALFVMSFVFPKSEKKFPFKITAVIIIPAVAMGLVVVATDITLHRAYFKDGILVREFKDFYTVYAAAAFLYIIAAVVNFIRKYFTLKVEIHKLQMRYVFVSSSLSILIASVFSIILPLFFNYSDVYVIGPAIAAFVTIGALFYSIIAHHLMDITTVIHKTSVYFVTSMVIVLPIYGIIEIYELGIWIIGDIPAYIIAGIIVVLFILFSVYIQPLIDRTFKRRQYEFGSVVDRFLREAEEVRDLDNIIKRIINTLQKSLYLERAFFILINDTTRKYELTHFQGPDEAAKIEALDRNSSIIRWFIRNQDILFIGRVYTDEKIFDEVRDDLSSFYNDNNIQLILPIYHERRLAGLLCLGEKETLAGYSPDEIEKLKYFNAKSSDFVSTALTYQRAMRDQLIARTIDLSSTILSDTVPKALPNMDSIKFGAFIIPKYEHGTDYFDFIRPGEHGVGVIATDISGVGVNSALNSVIMRSACQASVQDAPSTGTVVKNINRLLFNYSKGKGGLITAFYLYFDTRTMRLIYTNAGYPALELYRIEKKNFDSLDTEGIPLGYDGEYGYGAGRTDLQRGDIGLLYTKTLINSKNQKGEEFGLLRLRNIIMENRTRNAGDITERIRKTYESFMGLSTTDSDVLALVFKIV